MSVLVACRGLNLGAVSTAVGSVQISDMRLRTSYDEALDCWAVDEPDAWVAVLTWNNRLWDDFLNDALDGGEHLLRFKSALALLAASCDEVAIWYAGFPDEIPIADGPEEFAEAVAAQVATGELEPAVRMIRRK